MEIDKNAIELKLACSKARVLTLMGEIQLPNNSVISKFCPAYMNAIVEKQKQFVKDNMDRIYDEFFNLICEAAETEDDCVIKLYILHPNMWSDESNNCLLIILENKNADIDSRVEIYDNVYPTGISCAPNEMPIGIPIEFSSTMHTYDSITRTAAKLLNKDNQHRSPDEILKQLKEDITKQCKLITFDFKDK